MEKIVFVAFDTDAARADDAAPTLGPVATIPTIPTTPTTPTMQRNENLLATLDPARFPEVALQVEDRDATMRWQRRDRPLAGRVVATLAAWTECGDDASDVEAATARLSSEYAGFVVTEAVPRWRTDRSVSGTEPRPGVVMTSLLRRATQLSRDEFLAHWQHVHQPMSLRIHPQWTYVRNVVARALTAGAPDVDAICEEGFASVDDVLDPARFYGGDLTNASWQDNAQTIGNDVKLFLDAARTTSTIMREYRLRTFRR